MNIKKIMILPAAALTLAASLGSCNVYGKFKMPTDTPLTEEYVRACEASADSSAFGNLKWQQVFTDPVLVDLIYQALANNTDLRNAKLNVDMAHANLKGAKLSFLPSVALAPNGAGASYAGSDLSWSYQLPMSVSWEIDAFGKLLNNKRMQQASYMQTKAYEQAVRSQIIAAVANTYYALATTQRQLVLQESTSEKWAETVQTMKDLKEAAKCTEAAIAQSEAQYSSILGQITDTKAQLRQLNNTMSLLMNVQPQEWTTSQPAMLTVPTILRESIPMKELAARPDVRAAEYSLESAYYTTAAARAAFYPSINITANGGFTNAMGSMIRNPGDWFYQLAGQLTAPLFSRGQNIARLEASKAAQQKALNSFEYTLLSAASEVSNAMTVYEQAVAKSGYLEQQVSSLARAVEINETLLKVGGYNTTYLEVITAQQNLLGAQMSALACDLTQARALVNLYQSLGGGR
ncbi:MAG: TolC family protein [Muribaculaceae bacterium]|nr:TolC family protein [Muribaculaceae bacterium]